MPGAVISILLLSTGDKVTNGLSQGHIYQPRKVGTCPGLLDSVWGRVGGDCSDRSPRRGLHWGRAPTPWGPHQPPHPWPLASGIEAEEPST